MGLNRSLSDHNPVIIGECLEDWGPRPFRFFNGWLEDKSMMEGARNSWLKCTSGGSFGTKLAFKLKAVKKHVKACLKSKSSIGDSIKLLEEKLVDIEGRAVVNGWT